MHIDPQCISSINYILYNYRQKRISDRSSSSLVISLAPDLQRRLSSSLKVKKSLKVQKTETHWKHDGIKSVIVAASRPVNICSAAVDIIVALNWSRAESWYTTAEITAMVFHLCCVYIFRWSAGIRDGDSLSVSSTVGLQGKLSNLLGCK